VLNGNRLGLRHHTYPCQVAAASEPPAARARIIALLGLNQISQDTVALMLNTRPGLSVGHTLM
jgi:hypothetical protein